MANLDSQSHHGIDELRSILLGEDRRAVDCLRIQVNEQAKSLAENAAKLEHAESALLELRNRVGDDDKLRASVVPVLSQAIADVEKSNPRPLARAMSPFIVSSIRAEIANSKEAMVEALYPITGRLVSAAVKNSVASMMETINQRVNEATSARMLSARFKSWRSGDPVSSYMLAGPGEVIFHSAMLMERDTGAPICHVDPSGEEPRQEGQSNLVSGLLAALSNLTEEVFTGEDDELRTLDLNGRKITLRRSLRHMLVVEFIGILSADQHRVIDEKFAEVVALSENDDQEGLSGELTSIMQLDIDSDSSNSKNKGFAGAALGLALLALLCWYLFGVWQRAQLDNAAIELHQKISASNVLSAYPIEVSGDFEAGALRVSGLIPESLDPQALSVQWQEWANDYPVEVKLAAIADANRSRQLEQELNVVRAENRVLRAREQLPTSRDVPSESLQQRLNNLLDGLEIGLTAEGEFESGESLVRLRRIARLLIAAKSHLQVIALVPLDAAPDDDIQAKIVAKYLTDLGVSETQLQIAVQPSDIDPSDDGVVILELTERLP